MAREHTEAQSRDRRDRAAAYIDRIVGMLEEMHAELREKGHSYSRCAELRIALDNLPAVIERARVVGGRPDPRKSGRPAGGRVSEKSRT